MRLPLTSFNLKIRMMKRNNPIFDAFSIDRHSIIIGISGLEVTKRERKWLLHPLVSGVILFSRNYSSRQQLIALTREIRAINPTLLISVDHEGGRVQRFREGFTPIPPMGELGRMLEKSNNKERALLEIENIGEIIGRELSSVGIDFSYTPVCDLDYGHNDVIGDRSFHRDVTIVSDAVSALHRGLKKSGSIGIAKHFPGHGFVSLDTHHALAIDDRPIEEIMADLPPFRRLIDEGIAGIMPAHIIYPAFDPNFSAVSSEKWLSFLRNELNFRGAIISDDLDMAGANHLGSVKEKVEACFRAGINIVLICNDFEAIEKLLKKR